MTFHADEIAKLVLGGITAVAIFFLKNVATDLRKAAEMLNNHETRITVLEKTIGE